jgi:hypothetical protein
MRPTVASATNRTRSRGELHFSGAGLHSPAAIDAALEKKSEQGKGVLFDISNIIEIL